MLDDLFKYTRGSNISSLIENASVIPDQVPDCDEKEITLNMTEESYSE